MREFPFGGDAFSRSTIPDSVADLAAWPAVDETALPAPQQARYRNLRDAVSLFVAEPSMTIAEIVSRTGILPQTLYQNFRRCISVHPDGRIYGYRGLVGYPRTQYTRRKPVANDSSGTAGAFGQLMNRYPDVRQWLDREIARRRAPPVGSEIMRPRKAIHRELLRRLRAAGAESSEYPFHAQLLGVRALGEYIRRYEASAPDRPRRVADEAGFRAALAAEECAPPPAVRPYELVEADGHKIDLRLRIELVDPLGFVRSLDISRVWIVVVIEALTRCVLGYALVLRQEYGSSDVLAAIRNAVFPRAQRAFTIPGLRIPQGAGFPSELIGECRHAVWDRMRLDNHMAHHAHASVESIAGYIGAAVEFGRPSSPNDRSYIEPFFRHVSGHFAHRIPGTTGASPDDVRRALGDVGGSAHLRMTFDELDELLEVVLARYNATPHEGLGGRTPLEAMEYHVTRRNCLIRHLTAIQQQREHMLGQLWTAVVRGSEGRLRPHVNFLHVRYTSPVLAQDRAMVGQKLRLYVVPSDIRVIHAYLATGQEVGPLVARRPWNLTAHSIETRRAVWKEIADAKLRYSDEDDPVEIYLRRGKSGRGGPDKGAAMATARACREARAPDIGRESSQGDSPAAPSDGPGGVEPKILSIRGARHFC